MNDLEYLNQISAGVKKPAQNTGFFDKKMKTIIGALAGVILLLIVLVSVAGSSPSTPESTASTEFGRLKVYSDELIKTITTYNGSVRSSSLRSTGTSFSTLLTDISSRSTTYLTELGADPTAITATSSDTKILSDTTSSLESARLNGILDRRYASEMYFQIRYIINIESTISNKTTNSAIKAYLNDSTNSLKRLGDTFYNFSESN